MKQKFHLSETNGTTADIAVPTISNPNRITLFVPIKSVFLHKNKFR